MNKEVVAWCLYDSGASSFATSVLTVFFGPFITAVAHNAAAGADAFTLLGIPISPGAYYPYLISISVLIQIILLPALGSFADRTGRRKSFLMTAALLGSASVVSLVFIGDADVLSGGLLFILANVCFGASDVLYNAYLPEICAPKHRNTISSFGWGFGYFGAGMLLLAQYVFIMELQKVGVTDLHAAKYALVTCGIWWGGIAVITLSQLKTRERVISMQPLHGRQGTSFSRLRASLKGLLKYPQTLLFLVAFLLYSDGIQTITSVSTQFGQEEIGLSVDQLAEVILIVQFVGVLGALLFNLLAKWIGTKGAIMTGLSVFILIMLYSYGLLHTPNEFYIMAGFLALVLVGCQALSRAAFSKMIPPGKEAEYFGIYEISERGTSWLGPLFFGLALQFTGSYRTAIISLLLYFIIGAFLLTRVRFKQAEDDANATTMEFPHLRLETAPEVTS